MSPSPGRHAGSRQVLQSPESSRWLCLALGKDPAGEQEKDTLSRGPSRYAGVMRKGNFHGALPGGRTDTFQEGKGARGPGSQPHQTVSLAHTRLLTKPKSKVRRGASHKGFPLPHWEGQQTHTRRSHQAGASGSPAPSARSHQAQAPQLSAPSSVHGWEKGAGAEAGVPGPGAAVERNKQALVTEKTPRLPERSPPAQGPQLSGCGDLAPSPFSFTWYQEVPGQPGV